MDNETSIRHAPQNESGIHTDSSTASSIAFREGDLVDQKIADSPTDKGTDQKEFVWWSNKFHFTTNEKGEILEGKQEDDLSNPIGELPFCNFSGEQDGNFWALGGEDLVDGSINLNVFLTDLFYITKYQGMGLFYLFGKGIPKSIKVGPAEVLTMEMKQGDPTPQVGFASPSSALAEHMENVLKYLSLLLSTNKLQPGDIKGTMDAGNATSGLQEIIQRSDILEDIEDQQQEYRDKEPKIYRLYTKWHNIFLEKGKLHDDFAEIGKIDENVKLNTRFRQPQLVMTEKEKLEIIEKRRDIGLDTMIDSMIRDNPEMGVKEAEKKIVEIAKLKTEESRRKLMAMIPGDENGSKQSDLSNEPGEVNDSSEKQE